MPTNDPSTTSGVDPAMEAYTFAEFEKEAKKIGAVAFDDGFYWFAATSGTLIIVGVSYMDWRFVNTERDNWIKCESAKEAAQAALSALAERAQPTPATPVDPQPSTPESRLAELQRLAGEASGEGEATFSHRRMILESGEWTEWQGVNSQDWWWYWDGNDDNAPVVVSVLYSGTDGSYFASGNQLGWVYAQDLQKLGGWWQRIPMPSIAKRTDIEATPAQHPGVATVGRAIVELQAERDMINDELVRALNTNEDAVESITALRAEITTHKADVAAMQQALGRALWEKHQLGDQNAAQCKTIAALVNERDVLADKCDRMATDNCQLAEEMAQIQLRMNQAKALLEAAGKVGV